MIVKYAWPAIFFSALAVTACSESDVTTNSVIAFDRGNWAAVDFDCQQHSLTWSDVNDWHYQLQLMDFVELSETRHDLIVMDSEPQGGLNSNIVNRIRCDGDGEKLVMAYLPIGKAENFRNYWQDDWTVGNPSWIAAPNGDWQGEYIVRYWDPQWKSIIMGTPESRLDIILNAGFDGVVLDGLDLYQNLADENPSAIADLQAFVSEIRSYAESNTGNSNFGIFTINSESLINEPSIDWTSNLTGIIKSSHYYAPVDQPVDTALVDLYETQLTQWTAANKLVLTLDYTTEPDNISTIYGNAAERSYIPLVVPSVELDNLTILEGFAPD